MERRLTDSESVGVLDATKALHVDLLRQGHKKDLTLLQIAEYLYNIKTHDMTTRFESLPYSRWVAESFTDREGNPRSVQWADWLVGCWRYIGPMPKLKKLVQDGYESERGTVQIKLTRAAAAARYVEAVGYESTQVRRMLSELGDKHTDPLQGAKIKLRAAQLADDECCRLAMAKTSSQLKEDLQVLAKERMGAADPALPDERPTVKGKVDQGVLDAWDEALGKLKGYYEDDSTEELPLVRQMEMFAMFVEDILSQVQVEEEDAAETDL